MKEYPHIDTIWKRDERGKILEGQFSTPEFEYLKDNEWIFTEKVDGTNIRVMWDGENVRFGRKTDKAQIPAFLISRLQDLFLASKFQTVWSDSINICLYGEGYGARIQKGGENYNPNGCDFVLFDVWIDGWLLKREAVEEVALKLGIQVVPIVGYGNLFKAISLVRQGFKSQWGDFLAEGLVIRPKVDLFARNGKRIITKIKNRDFIKQKEGVKNRPSALEENEGVVGG